MNILNSKNYRFGVQFHTSNTTYFTMNLTLKLIYPENKTRWFRLRFACQILWRLFALVILGSISAQTCYSNIDNTAIEFYRYPVTSFGMMLQNQTDPVLPMQKLSGCRSCPGLGSQQPSTSTSSGSTHSANTPSSSNPLPMVLAINYFKQDSEEENEGTTPYIPCCVCWNRAVHIFMGRCYCDHCIKKANPKTPTLKRFLKRQLSDNETNDKQTVSSSSSAAPTESEQSNGDQTHSAMAADTEVSMEQVIENVWLRGGFGNAMQQPIASQPESSGKVLWLNGMYRLFETLSAQLERINFNTFTTTPFNAFATYFSETLAGQNESEFWAYSYIFYHLMEERDDFSLYTFTVAAQVIMPDDSDTILRFLTQPRDILKDTFNDYRSCFQKTIDSKTLNSITPHEFDLLFDHWITLHPQIHWLVEQLREQESQQPHGHPY